MKLSEIRSAVSKTDSARNVNLYCKIDKDDEAHYGGRWTDDAPEFRLVPKKELNIIESKNDILRWLDSWISRYGPQATLENVLRNKKPTSSSKDEESNEGAGDSGSNSSQSGARRKRRSGSGSGKSTRVSRGDKPGTKPGQGLCSRMGAPQRSTKHSQRTPTRTSTIARRTISHQGLASGSDAGKNGSPNYLRQSPASMMEGSGALREGPAGICALTNQVKHLRRNPLASKCSSLVKRLIQGQDVAISETKGTISGKKLIKELTTRRCRLDSIHKKDRAKKDILILVDVSSSCAANCEESLATAYQIVKDFRGRAQLVVHSNGWPVEVMGNRLDPDTMPYYGRDSEKSVADWAQTYNWGLILVLGDSDVLWLLQRLDNSGSRIIWLDKDSDIRRQKGPVAKSQNCHGLKHCERFINVRDVRDTIGALKKLRR